MSDDIPIIFADDILNPGRKAAPVAVFLSAAGPSQMEQYAAGGWRVLAAPGFAASLPVELAKVSAAACAEEEIAGCTLLSCEATFLRADTGARIAKGRPEIVKINCAFHNVSDAASLASSLTGMGYTVLGAQWRDDNSFSIRHVEAIQPIAAIQLPDWDRINIIGVRDPARVQALLSVARLYGGEEKRIAELRVANAIRNDHIARLEDALAAHQSSETFKLRRS